MAHFDTKPPHDKPTNMYPGREAYEPCVPNPKHVAGQTDIRPNFEQESPMHAKSRSPNPRLPRFKGHEGPLD